MQIGFVNGKKPYGDRALDVIQIQMSIRRDGDKNLTRMSD